MLGLTNWIIAMSRRFSRLRDANRLEEAADRYLAWIAASATRVPNVGGGASRGPSVELGITPFGFDLPASTFVRASATDSSRVQMSSDIGTFATVPGAGVSLQRIPGFKPARAALFIGTGTRTTATSAITGLPYNKYSGDRYSHPFGRGAATDLEFEVFGTIRTNLAGPNRRISYQAEVRSQV